MSFPTTLWTTIRRAGEADPGALERFALRYRAPVLEYLRRRGYRQHDAEDICQDVFVRVLRQGVLQKADRERGRFRSLLLTITLRTLQDRARKRSEQPDSGLVDALSHDRSGPVRDDEFDETWALSLAERAMTLLRQQGSTYYPVLVDHLSGTKVDRNKLWIARSKLINLIRREVALTCATPEDLEDELLHLSSYLRPKAARDGQNSE